MLGLTLAIDRFDARREIGFRYFAMPTIAGELRRYFRDRTWSVRVTRRTEELSLELRRREPELAQRLGRTPTQADLAADLGLSEDDIRNARLGITAHRAHSLNYSVLGADHEPVELGELIGGLDREMESVPDRDALRRALRLLSPRLLAILRHRYVDGLSQRKIAELMGVSQMHVSRLISRSLSTLRTHMTV
jgi:RNA polymerase sigma-B factor